MTQSHWKKTFAIICAGQMFSLLGSAAVQFAVIWWLTEKTGSALVLTTLSIVAFLPNMVLGPFVGVWIDRFNRRTVMMLADGLVALSSVALGVAFFLLESPPLGLIYAVLLLRGIGNTFHAPAMQAAVPMLVPADMLTKAGGWGNLINSVSSMLGPVLGAAMLGMAPMTSIMLVDVAGAAIAIVLLLFVRIPDVPQSAEKPTFMADWKMGFAAIRDNKPLMAVLPTMLLCNILFMPLGSLFPLLVNQHFMGTAWHNGIVELVFAAGLLVSSLVVGVWGGLKRRFLMVALAIGVLGVTSSISGALPSGGFIAFVICCFFMGCTGTFINVPLMAYTQETTAPEMMGKVFSLMMTGMSLAMPIGLLLAGPFSEVVGVDRWFFWSGLAIMAAAVLCRLGTRRYDAQTMRPEIVSEAVAE